MAILCETGSCICCSLRIGVQTAVVISLMCALMGFYSSTNALIRAFDGDDEWLLKYKEFHPTCAQITCSADDKSCFRLSLADGADGSVKELQIPRLASGMEEEFGAEDPTKWKLDKVEAFKDDALLWPTGNTKNNATLQNVMSTAKADCQGKDADADILMFTFDWSADPTQDARRADSQKWRTWQKAGALLGLLENACYIVVDV